MAWEYKVISPLDLVQEPSFWQMPASKAKEYRNRMEEALNRMSAEGWDLVTSCPAQYTALFFDFYLIFRRPQSEGEKGAPETGIKKA
jgi:Domain of unknown function (DUF4177)